MVANDGIIEGRIQVKAPDDVVYDCDANCVYVPMAGEPEPPESAHEEDDEGCGCGSLHEGLCQD